MSAISACIQAIGFTFLYTTIIIYVAEFSNIDQIYLHLSVVLLKPMTG